MAGHALGRKGRRAERPPASTSPDAASATASQARKVAIDPTCHGLAPHGLEKGHAPRPGHASHDSWPRRDGAHRGPRARPGSSCQIRTRRRRPPLRSTREVHHPCEVGPRHRCQPSTRARASSTCGQVLVGDAAQAPRWQVPRPCDETDLTSSTPWLTETDVGVAR